MQRSVLPYVGSAVAVGVAALVAAGINQVVTLPHVTVLMLLAVFFSAVQWGRGPSLFAAVCSIAVSSFFFMPPIYSFYVSAPQDVLDLIVFFIAAVVTSHFASRTKLQAAEAARREMNMLQLSTFSRSLAGLLDADGVLRATAVHCTVTFQRRTVLLIPRNGRLAEVFAQTGASPLSDAAVEYAHRLWHERDAGIAVDNISGIAANGWELRRLRGERSLVGLLAIETAVAAITPKDEHAIESALPQIARIVERAAGIGQAPTSSEA